VGCYPTTHPFLAQPLRSFKTSNATLKASAESTTVAANAEKSSFIKDHPFKFQLLVATGKTMAADLMVQVVTEGKKLDEIDWKRNGIFVVFGFTYLGGFQYWLMVNKYRQWFPTMDRFAKLPFAEKVKDIPGILDAGKMVLFDIFVHLPFIYFPTYYTVKEFVGGSSYNPIDWMKDGMTKWSKNFQDDFTALVKLWGTLEGKNIHTALQSHYYSILEKLMSFLHCFRTE
jgi:hypothetical protein